MKKILLLLCVITPLFMFAQQTAPKHSADFELGSGLTFSFDEGAYVFSLGGMIQPYIAYLAQDEGNADKILNSKRSFFHFKGSALDNKVAFCFRTDFSQSQPLLDVYIKLQAFKGISLSLGQKQTMANNREMLLLEDQLVFADRSLLSTQYSLSGREFGLFLDSEFSLGSLYVLPSIAITSGDGRNAFGADSRDVDLGGLKYAARLDMMPFGRFEAGNENTIADLHGESRPKLLLGMAASMNRGASEVVGEGHGSFFLYDEEGRNLLPVYRQLYFDLLFKWQGVSMLGEYMIGTAAGLEGSYTDAFGNNLLIPTQISEYLALGRGYNVQLGYCYKSAYGVDLSFSAIQAEFEYNPMSVIGDMKEYRIAFTRYFHGQNMKLLLAGSMLEQGDISKQYKCELLFQLRI